jgi:hypothetical protein
MIGEVLISPRKQRAIEALLTERTQAAAAEVAKVPARTLRSWLRDPVFETALASAAAARMRGIATGLARHVDRAIEVLGETADGTIKPNGARVRAAFGLVSLVQRERELRVAEELRELLGDRDTASTETYGGES